MLDKPVKVAVYARVSDDKLTEEGARRQDINRQIDKLLQYSARAGWEVIHLYEDDGKSAYKDDYASRPAFTQLMRDIKGHHVKRVLVEDMTRWFRRLEEGLRTLREAAECGCTVTSTMEGEVDVTSTEGWMKASMCLLFAEWASRSQADKVRSGMKRRKNDKRHLCASCGFVHIGRHPAICGCEKCEKKRRVNPRVQ